MYDKKAMPLWTLICMSYSGKLQAFMIMIYDNKYFKIIGLASIFKMQ